MTPRDLKTIRAGLLTLSVAFVLKSGIYPAWQSHRARVLELQKEVRLLGEDLIALESSGAGSALDDSTAAAVMRALRPLFNGTDINLIAADVEEYVRSLAEATTFSASRITVRVDSAVHHGTQRIDVDVHGQAGYGHVVDLLRRLEQGNRVFRASQLLLKPVYGDGEILGAEAVVTELQVQARFVTYAVQPDGQFGLGTVARNKNGARAASATR